MSVGYSLVNHSNKEVISFSHVDASSARELAGNEASSAITTWYMLQNAGDRIAFVSDTYDDWPFEHGFKTDLEHYKDVTDAVVSDLINEGILVDEGRFYEDEDEPSNVFVRQLRNGWTKNG